MSQAHVNDTLMGSVVLHDAAFHEARAGAGLNKDTVVKLLLAWTVTPICAGIVAAGAYFVLSHLSGS